MRLLGRHVLAGAVSACVLLTALAGCQPAGQVAAGPEPEATKLKDEMRMPWSPAAGGFLREWLICGSFPSPSPYGRNRPPGADPSGKGLGVDYLAPIGGEAAARPTEGRKVPREGAAAVWKRLVSDRDDVDLLNVFAGEPDEFVVAYAYTTVRQAGAGDAVLALGSDDSVKVWLNGKLVHENRAGRGVRKDEDIVPVTLRKGDNALLLKVENGRGGWGFVVRVLTRRQAAGLEIGEIRPRIEPPPAGEPNLLVVCTDAGLGAAAGRADPVAVEVVAPGGKVVSRQQATRGQTVRVDAGGWADGPYEVRVSTTSDGYPVFQHLAWYKGGWLAQVRELLDAFDKLPARSEGPADLRLGVLGRLVLDRLGGDPRRPKGDPKAPPELRADGWAAVHSPLMEHAEWKLGEAGAIRAGGLVRLAWRDAVDDSPQFARAYLPPLYSRAKRWPVVVVLHGYNPANPEYIHWWSVTSRHSRLADRHGVIVVEPHGRGNTGYEGIGDADVLRAIDEAKRRLSVDERRVYLTGYSMGGGGTWHVGTRHPDVFAAIAPIYGGWDYHVRMDEEDLAKLTPRRRFQAERWSSFVQAESLLTTPVFVNHGDADSLVDVDHSRYAVRMLQRWGYNIRYWEHPGKGHGALGCEDELMRWFLSHRLDPAPRRVRLRAAHLRHAAAHWLRVEQRRDPYAFIVAEARAVGAHTLRVDTDNVLALRLSPPPQLVDCDRPVRVIWNGEDTGEHRLAGGAIVLRAKGYRPEAGRPVKTPAICGPLDDVETTPFAIVIGTASKDPRMRRFCRFRAEAARDQWRQWQHVAPRCFLDTEITDEQIRSHSLRLFGGPEANLVTRKLARHLPLKLARDAITIDGHRFGVENAGVRMIRPHPRNPARYVAVQAGSSPAGMFHSDGVPGHYDFAIAEARLTTEEMGFAGDEGLLVAGCFDPNWRYDERYARRCEAARLAKAPPLKAPKHLTAAVEAPRLALSELLETRSSGSFANMRRDRNWLGRAIRVGGRTYAGGIGVSVWHEPCVAAYDLTGGGWKRLRATLGIEVDEPEKLEQKQKDGTRVYFVVRGDGKELYRSPTFGWDSTGGVEMDVDVRGVKTLKLEVANEATWHNAARSVNWADVRLEK